MKAEKETTEGRKGGKKKEPNGKAQGAGRPQNKNKNRRGENSHAETYRSKEDSRKHRRAKIKKTKK